MPRLPKVTIDDTQSPDVTRLFRELETCHDFTGEVRSDFATRIAVSTDNSLYQMIPSGVVYPRTAQDVSRLFEIAGSDYYAHITFSPRGGGTGTNGQSLSRGVVIDMSKYMTGIRDLDTEAGTVVVEPGVILDQLNAYLATHNRMFAPSISTSSRATIGGMINTDACGKGSAVYGRTADHIVSLTVVDIAGKVHTFEQRDLETATALEHAVHQLISPHHAEIQSVFPKLKRYLTGYDLAHSVSENTVNLTRLIAGSEGTLGVVVDATLQVVALPTHRQCVMIGYPSFDAALDDARRLTACSVTAIETMDDTLLEVAKTDVFFDRVRHLFEDSGSQAINYVEIVTEDHQTLDDRVNAVYSATSSDHIRRLSESDAAGVWEIRKRAVGILANSPGKQKPMPFIEDTAVHVDVLPDYIRDLKNVLDRHGLRYAMFGHPDVGCVHVRPAVDIQSEIDRQKIDQISDDVCQLIQRYGGNMWAEHGRGFRAAYTQAAFGESLFGVLKAIKRLFDPHNRLNPGKIVTPDPESNDVVNVNDAHRGERDRDIASGWQTAFPTAMSCNGNGVCFQMAPSRMMCPSYKGTRDRVQSPKGRASIIREWMRQLSVNGIETIESITPYPLLSRVWHTLFNVSDMSHDLVQAYDSCLSCKGCTTECPVYIDIPDIRSRLLDAYYSRYCRPVSDLVLAWVEPMVFYMSRWPAIWNGLTQSVIGKWGARLIGLQVPPKMGTDTLGSARRDNDPFFRFYRPDDTNTSTKDVVVLVDTFTGAFDWKIVGAFAELLHKFGHQAVIVPIVRSGKIDHIRGNRSKFNKIACRVIDVVSEIEKRGAPIVGIDPAFVTLFRDEYQTACPDRHHPKVMMVQEFLNTISLRPTNQTGDTVSILPHCYEQSLPGNVPGLWEAVFEKAGVKAKVEQVGCCGMAGLFGYQQRHRELSNTIYELDWGRYRDADHNVGVCGHSCRQQVLRQTGALPLHPIEILNEKVPGY